jgi:hypothetical protein
VATDSILNSIKKLLGYDAEYTAFDDDILLFINSTFSTLHQIGASPVDGFFIEDATPTWADFLENRLDVNFVRSYMFLKVKLLHDPPANNPSALEAIQKQITEYEWRLQVSELTFNPHAYDHLDLKKEEA